MFSMNLDWIIPQLFIVLSYYFFYFSFFIKKWINYNNCEDINACMLFIDLVHICWNLLLWCTYTPLYLRPEKHQELMWFSLSHLVIFFSFFISTLVWNQLDDEIRNFHKKMRR